MAVTEAPGDRPLVSVIIPAFNRPEMLERAMASVLAQSYRQLELLVVDDGSPTDLGPVVSRFPDARVSYHRRQENNGVSAARNRGVSLAKGGYVAFLDSDDEWRPTKLEREMAELRSHPSDYRFVYCLKDIYDEDKGFLSDRNWFQGEGDVYRQMARYSYLGTPSTWLMQRSLFEELDGFDEAMSYAEDWDMSIRISKATKVACVKERLVVLHEHGQERLSRDLDSKPHVASCLIALYQRHQELFRSDPEAHASMLKDISYYLRSSGDVKGARRYAWKLVRLVPFKRSTYEYLGRALVSR